LFLQLFLDLPNQLPDAAAQAIDHDVRYVAVKGIALREQLVQLPARIIYLQQWPVGV
jgi:hypothetical protein